MELIGAILGIADTVNYYKNLDSVDIWFRVGTFVALLVAAFIMIFAFNPNRIILKVASRSKVKAKAWLNRDSIKDFGRNSRSAIYIYKLDNMEYRETFVMKDKEAKFPDDTEVYIDNKQRVRSKNHKLINRTDLQLIRILEVILFILAFGVIVISMLGLIVLLV